MIFILIVMRIENSPSPSFGAIYIDKAKIAKKILNSPLYKDEFVSCIKIDPFNKGDINALKNIADYWEYGHFTTNIYHAANAMKNDSKYYKYNQIFAITEQADNFENLNCDKILGLVHVSPLENNSLYIEHIEAKPSIISKQKREIKGIGTAMLDYLKTITNTIVCFPSNTVTVKNFYFKNGFIEYPQKSNLFIWSKQV